MPRDTKPKPTAAHAPESSFASVLSGMLRQGIGGFFTTQRILLDLVTRQNASAMKIMRETWFGSSEDRTTILTELAREGMANFIEAQKVVLNLARRESELVMMGVQERVQSPAVFALTELVRRSVDTFVDMQQHFLEMAGKHSKGWLEAVKTGSVYTGGSFKEVTREAIENFMEAQKTFLDVIAEETAHAMNGKHRMAKKGKKIELTELAQRATESFIDAQKKLLDVASKQVNTNLEMAGRASKTIRPVSFEQLAEMTREVVKSYVEAQKALLDVMVKPQAEQTPEHAAKKAATRAKRAVRKVPMARTAQAGAAM